MVRQQSVNHQGQGLLCNLHCATTVHARIQDFELGGEMGGENQRNQILFQYLGDKQKERRGLKKWGGGGENSPVSPPLDPRLL